uniref:CBFD_NFYB_HMF domain-containing protein n=1 Tax=Angiostrongylus costaricensis TaxID=334426 RepID=A0A0R3PTG2_ANGCS
LSAVRHCLTLRSCYGVGGTPRGRLDKCVALNLELFAAELAKASYTQAVLEKRKTIQTKDLSMVFYLTTWPTNITYVPSVLSKVILKQRRAYQALHLTEVGKLAPHLSEWIATVNLQQSVIEENDVIQNGTENSDDDIQDVCLLL